jgi:thiamine biosynthesis lipoprotein
MSLLEGHELKLQVCDQGRVAIRPLARRPAMNRRQFLTPCLEPQLGAPAAEARATEAPEFTLLRYSRRAMGTAFEVALPWGAPGAHAAADAALNLIDQLEAQLSIYRDDSELSQINRGADREPLPVEPRFFDLLTQARSLSDLSLGAFDPACGALIEAWGFFRGPPRVPAPAERNAALRQSGMRFVLLDPRQRTIRLARPGVKLNLGAIGKGYALDRAAELLRREFGIAAALLTAGRSSILALGSPPGSPAGWPIGLTDPRAPQRRLATLWLRDQALGVSADTYQALEFEGRRLGHLLDPRTGWPGAQWAMAVCQTSSAAHADALATAYYLSPEADLRRWNPAAASALLLPFNDERFLVISAGGLRMADRGWFRD